LLENFIDVVGGILEHDLELSGCQQEKEHRIVEIGDATIIDQLQNLSFVFFAAPVQQPVEKR
jgi:hypothetical protein